MNALLTKAKVVDEWFKIEHDRADVSNPSTRREKVEKRGTHTNMLTEEAEASNAMGVAMVQCAELKDVIAIPKFLLVAKNKFKKPKKTQAVIKNCFFCHGADESYFQEND